MSESTYERQRNGAFVEETEYMRTWQAKHGHRWVIIDGHYYPAGERARVLAARSAKRMGITPRVLPAPIGSVR